MSHRRPVTSCLQGHWPVAALHVSLLPIPRGSQSHATHTHIVHMRTHFTLYTTVVYTTLGARLDISFYTAVTSFTATDPRLIRGPPQHRSAAKSGRLNSVHLHKTDWDYISPDNLTNLRQLLKVSNSWYKREAIFFFLTAKFFCSL